MGDSNLVRLSKEIDEDNLLQAKNVSLRCRPGLRAKHLNAEDLLFCSKFDICILVVGNNDISSHPTKKWIVPESPRNTAAKLYAFAMCLMDLKTETRVVGLMPRPDVKYDIVKKTNDYLKFLLAKMYVGPRKVHSSHFIKENSKDLAHLNFFGKKLVLALILRIIDTRF